MAQYLLNLGIAVDQLFNVLFGGWPDETLSAVAHRYAPYSMRWNIVRKLLNLIFFWQDDHCQAAFYSELDRLQLPEDYRER
jgi:hypothetical protein